MDIDVLESVRALTGNKLPEQYTDPPQYPSCPRHISLEDFYDDGVEENNNNKLFERSILNEGEE